MTKTERSLDTRSKFKINRISHRSTMNNWKIKLKNLVPQEWNI